MGVADMRHMVLFKLMFPLNDRFGIVFFQIFQVIVYQMAMVAFFTRPTYPISFCEVLHKSSIYSSIHFSSPFLVCFQVNQPYVISIMVPDHHLPWTNHLQRNITQIFAFQLLPKLGITVAVSMEKNYAPLSNI